MLAQMTHGFMPEQKLCLLSLCGAILDREVQKLSMSEMPILNVKTIDDLDV